MFRPTFGGGQFDVVKTRGLNAVNGFFDGKSVVAVGIHSNDMAHACAPEGV